MTLETQLFTAFAVLVTVVGLLIAAYIAKRYGANEDVQRAIKGVELIGKQALDWVMTVRYGNVRLDDYNGVNYYEREQNSVDTYGRFFDARMLFVIDRVEEAYLRATGRKAEFDDIWPTAERVYQFLNRSDNGLDMNPAARKRRELAAAPDAAGQTAQAAPLTGPKTKRRNTVSSDATEGVSSVGMGSLLD